MMRLYQFKFSQNAKEIVDHWNIQCQTWLKQCKAADIIILLYFFLLFMNNKVIVIFLIVSVIIVIVSAIVSGWCYC